MKQVHSIGYGDADIYFLGGAPSKSDLNLGHALSGGTENTLNGFLAAHKMSVKNIYRGLVIREELKYHGTSVKKLNEALASVNNEHYQSVLLDELKSIQPNVIVPLDDIALAAVYPEIQTMKKPKGRMYWVYCYRGSILPLRADWQGHFNKTIKVIPTIGPQLLYQDHTARSYATLDYQRIYQYKDSTGPIETYGIRWVVRSVEEFRKFINRYINEAAFLTFDIETYGGLLTCISFSFNGIEGVSVPLTDTKINRSEMAMLWRMVAKLLAHPIPKVNQNIKYDWIILERHNFYVNNVVGDTMVLGHTLYPELPKGLDFLTSIYTEIPYYKDEGKEFDPSQHRRDRLYLYNAMDSIAAHKIYQEQLKELDENLPLKQLYHNEIVPLIGVYKNLDTRGLRIDDLKRKKLLSYYTDLYDRNLDVLRKLVGKEDFNPRSAPQVGVLLYEELRFPIRRKRDESGRPSYKTDKETLDDLLIHHGLDSKAGVVGYKIISRIIMCRKLAKVVEYIQTPIHPDGRFRASSNLCGTETGRSSSTKSGDRILEMQKTKFKEISLGRSLQTISKHGFVVDDDVFDDFEASSIASDLRSMFVPSHGYVFLEADGSQAEARHVAVLAEDYDLLHQFDVKPKIHARTAGMIFGIDPATITKDFPAIPKVGIAYYDLGKRIRHAGNYKMGPGRLAQMTHLAFPECKTMLEKFHSMNPKIREVFHRGVEQAIDKNRTLVTPYGRTRVFYGYRDEQLYKEAVAYIPQSTVSDHTKFTVPRLLAIHPDAYLLTEQHDGLLFEVKKERFESIAHDLKLIMERPLNYSLGTLSREMELIVPAEVSMSDTNWMELKDYHG